MSAPSALLDCPREPMLSDSQIERYSRQIVLPQVGGRGQTALLAATVSVLGAGDMAAVASLYLTAAGVGCVRVTEATKQLIEGMNPDCHVTCVETSMTADAVRDAAVVLCAGEDATTCARIGEACVAEDIPWIVGATANGVGWALVCRGIDAPCPECVARAMREPGPAATREPLDRATAGVVGTLLATDAIKMVIGLPTAAAGRRLVFDARDGALRNEAAPTDPDCPRCGNAERSIPPR